MPILPASANEFRLPTLYGVRQHFNSEIVNDIPAAISAEFRKTVIFSQIEPGMQVAIGVGSRGIRNLAQIVKCVCDSIKALGATPIIIPAMGSHGAGMAEGQLAYLAEYGITEETMDVQILSCMDVVKIGETPDGIPVMFDKKAAGMDAIIPIGRVKPHTDFSGPIESGLCKMLAIGFAKHEGCFRIHQEGFDHFAQVIPAVAAVSLQNLPVKFGIAILENGYDQTALIEAVPADQFFSREPELLKIAYKNMPGILLSEIDVLIIEEIGKNISGGGMDPNIIGRTIRGPKAGYTGPTIQQIIVKKITEESHGNAAGIGLADITLKSLVKSINEEITYANAIASTSPACVRTPISFETEEEAIRAAACSCVRIDRKNPRVVKIKNTLDLETIYVSANLLDEVKINQRMELIDGDQFTF